MNAKEFSVKVAYLNRENKKWPDYLCGIAKEDWPSSLSALKEKPTAVLRSSQFLVQIFPEKSGAVRITACRTTIGRDGNWRADISWEDLMALKSESGFASWWAVEIFPPDNEVVNVANMRHLWVVDEAPVFAWRSK